TEGTVIALVGADQRKAARKLARSLDLDVTVGGAEMSPIRAGERTPIVEAAPRSSSPKRAARGKPKGKSGGNGRGSHQKRRPQERSGAVEPSRSGGKARSHSTGASTGNRSRTDGKPRRASGPDGRSQHDRSARRSG